MIQYNRNGNHDIIFGPVVTKIQYIFTVQNFEVYNFLHSLNPLVYIQVKRILNLVKQ